MIAAIFKWAKKLLAFWDLLIVQALVILFHQTVKLINYCPKDMRR